MTITSTGSKLKEASLEHLFDFELTGRSGEPYVSAKDRDGPFIVNGEGSVTGKIQGRIKMSFFAKDCALPSVLAGVDPGSGLHLCQEDDGGVIETSDGARIVFDTRGYGLRGADPASPGRWRLSMAVQFSTNDERYKWLNTSFGLWEGQFDEENGKAHYTA